MFFVKMVALAMLALVSVSASAGLPMAQKPFTSPGEFAERLRTGSGMNASAEQYIRAYQEYHPGALDGVRTIEQYARNLEMVPCPQGVLYRLKSVERGNLGEITREFKPGEMCFMDRNIGEIVQSASCGNVAKAVESHEPVRSYEPPPRVEYRDRPVYVDRPVYQPPQVVYVEQEPIVVYEEASYGGSSGIVEAGLLAYGYSQGGDHYDDHSTTIIDSYNRTDNRRYIDKRSNYGNRYRVDNRVDNRQWTTHHRPREYPRPIPGCQSCGGGGGPAQPPTGPIGCPGGNCGGGGGPAPVPTGWQ